MITVTFNRISLAIGSVISPTPFTLYYKLISDADYTLIEGGIYVDEDGYILSSPLPSISVDETGTYIFKAVNDFCGAIYYQQFYINNTNLYEWVGDDGYCEQSTPLNLFDSVTGFADPYNIGYDSTSGNMYVVDASAITQGSNIYYFDVSGLITAADVTPVGSLNVAAIASVIDTTLRRIYITGPDTGGMVVYDIASDTVTNIAFGTDSLYARTALFQSGNDIVSLDDKSLLKTIVDATTLAITSSTPYSSIPDYELYFAGVPNVRGVGSDWWVLASQGAGFGPPDSSIAVYNSDFSSLIGTIALPGQVLWTNLAYWRTSTIIGDILFVYDAGSNQLMTVNTTTQVVTQIHTFTNREGKTNSLLTVIQDAVTGDLYATGVWTDDANTDTSPIEVTYKLDPVTYEPSYIYPGIIYGTPVVREGASDILVGVFGGVRVYPTNPVGASTDGLISIFTKSGTGDNTGTFIWVTIQKVNTVTGVPTGDVALNTPGEPNYILPFEDLSTCPVIYTELCPDVPATFTGSDAEYEYSLEPSTYNNPVIDHIDLQQVDTVTTIVVATTTVTKNLYQNGTLTKVGANPNRVDLLFKDAANNTLSTCTNVFTIP